MFALLLCLPTEPCVALIAARFDPAAARIFVTDTTMRTTSWPAATLRLDTGRIDINLPPLFKAAD